MSFDPMGYPQFTETADGQKDAEIEQLTKCARFAEEGVTALTERLEEKDAEIERLKSELVKAFSEVTYQRTLITELADRLEKIDHNWPNEDYGIDAELIQRAREATK